MADVARINYHHGETVVIAEIWEEGNLFKFKISCGKTMSDGLLVTYQTFGDAKDFEQAEILCAGLEKKLFALAMVDRENEK